MPRTPHRGRRPRGTPPPNEHDASTRAPRHNRGDTLTYMDEANDSDSFLADIRENQHLGAKYDFTDLPKSWREMPCEEQLKWTAENLERALRQNGHPTVSVEISPWLDGEDGKPNYGGAGVAHHTNSAFFDPDAGDHFKITESIKVSAAWICSLETDAQAREIILHEVGHVLSSRHGHDETWRESVRSLGGCPDVRPPALPPLYSVLHWMTGVRSIACSRCPVALLVYGHT